MTNLLLIIIGLLYFAAGCGTSPKPVSHSPQTPQVKPLVATPVPQSIQDVAFVLGREEGFRDLQYLPDGKSLGGLTSNRIELFDVSALQQVRSLEATSESYTAMAVEQKGNSIALAQGNAVIFWDSVSGEQRNVFQANKKILTLSFNPDSSLLAVGGYDTVITLWDPVKERKVTTLRGHTNWVNTLSFHPNGKLLASGGDDGKVLLWDVGGVSNRPLQPITVMEQYQSEIKKVLFSHDGRVLASLDKNGTAIIWDPATGKRLATLSNLTVQGNPTSRSSTKVLSMTFSPDDRVLALGSLDKRLLFWSIAEGKVTKILSGNQDLPLVVHYSPDKPVLVVAGNSISFLDLEDGKVLQSNQKHTGTIQSLSFSLDSSMLIAGSSNKKITLWNLVDKNPIKILEGSDDPATSLSFSPDGTHLASRGAESDSPIIFWDLENGKPAKFLKGPRQKIRNLTFRPDGQQLAIVSEHVLLWDLRTGDTVVVTRSSLPEKAPIAFSPDGKWFALATGEDQRSFLDTETKKSDNSVILWDTETPKEIRILSGSKNPVQTLLFSPDGQTLVSSDSSEMTFWNVQSGKIIKTFAEPSQDKRFLMFSPDSKFLIYSSGSEHNEIVFLSAGTGQITRTLRGHENAITSLLLGPENLLASTSYNKIILWDSVTGQLVKTFEANRPFDFLSFSPDGKILASGAYDKIILWDIDKGAVLTDLQGSGFSHLAIFSPNGKILTTILQDQVTFWDVQNGNLLRTLEKSGPSLSTLIFSSDGQVLAAIGDVGYKTFGSWDINSGKTLTVLDGINHKITSLAFNPLHEILAVGSEDGVLLIWDVKTKKVTKALTDLSGSVVSLSIDSDNKVLVSQSSNSVLFWDIDKGSIIRILLAFPLYAFFFNPEQSDTRLELTDIGNSQHVAFSPDLKTLAFINRSNAVTLLDAKTGQTLKTLERETYSSAVPSFITFSPDGKLLALKDELGIVTVWEVESGKILHTFVSTGKILFSPDGKTLVSEGIDENHTITLWDVMNGQIIRTLSQSGYDTVSMAFSPDGKYLALGGETGIIRVYNMQ
jgi:WD40 repeat protein